MEIKKITQDELYKHVDALLEELDSCDTDDGEISAASENDDAEVKKSDDEVEVEVKAKTETEEEDVEKAKKDKKKKEDDEEDDEEEKEQPEQFQKKKAMKKSVEVDEEQYNEMLAKAEKLDALEKTEKAEEGDSLQKALNELDELKKSIENLKKSPAEKKSVDGLEVIEKGNIEVKEEKSSKDLLKNLTRSKVASIMVDDLIIKGVEGVSSQDVCEFEANGFLSNEIALEKTLEAINKRYNNGLL